MAGTDTNVEVCWWCTRGKCLEADVLPFSSEQLLADHWKAMHSGSADDSGDARQVTSGIDGHGATVDVPAEQEASGGERWHCSACQLALQSSTSFAAHVKGRKHLKKIGTPKPKPFYAAISEERWFEQLAAGKFKRVAVLTGAGVSTAAGIPDFRSKGGGYEQLQEK
jgi:hypothetical protein